jgi:hypothetical protein
MKPNIISGPFKIQDASAVTEKGGGGTGSILVQKKHVYNGTWINRKHDFRNILVEPEIPPPIVPKSVIGHDPEPV